MKKRRRERRLHADNRQIERESARLTRCVGQIDPHETSEDIVIDRTSAADETARLPIAALLLLAIAKTSDDRLQTSIATCRTAVLETIALADADHLPAADHAQEIGRDALETTVEIEAARQRYISDDHARQDAGPHTLNAWTRRLEGGSGIAGIPRRPADQA